MPQVIDEGTSSLPRPYRHTYPGGTGGRTFATVGALLVGMNIACLDPAPSRSSKIRERVILSLDVDRLYGFTLMQLRTGTRSVTSTFGFDNLQQMDRERSTQELRRRYLLRKRLESSLDARESDELRQLQAQSEAVQAAEMAPELERLRLLLAMTA